MMNRIEGVRNLKKSIQLLRKLSMSKIYDASSPDFDEVCKISFRKVKKGFGFSLNHKEILFNPDQFRVSNVLIENDQLKFNVSSLYVTDRTVSQIKGRVGRISSLNFNREKTAFHRLIIPVDKKCNFTFSVENVLIQYVYKTHISSRNAIQVSLIQGNFLLYQITKKINNTKNNYIVLESDISMLFSDFTEACYSILLGFGFISGYFIQDEGFFFQYEEYLAIHPSAFYHTTLRDSIKCSYVPTYANPNGYIHDPEIAERFKDKLRTLSQAEFSLLCRKIAKDDDFKSIILLILESNTQSLVSSPGMLSIALETISKIIYNENKYTLAPITDKIIAKRLRAQLKSEISKFSSEISSEGIIILNSRINNINQITNRDKLLLPFKILNIKINENDINAIDQRNAFLHGNTPMILNENPEGTDNEFKFRYFLYLKLYTLISSIILKYFGFDNLILNYPKIYELNTGISLDEDHYRDLSASYNER